MPKITHNSLIDLTAFRQKNGLLQQDIADYLGVSRGYISMVEKGASKLSRKNLDKLFEGKSTKQWDMSDLVPAFTRFEALTYYLNVERNKQREANGLPPTYFTGVDAETEEKIRYGEIGLGENAEFIKMWCESAPEVNIEWVVSGKGEMLNKIVEQTKEPSAVEILLQEVLELKASIAQMERSLNQRMDELTKMILSRKSE